MNLASMLDHQAQRKPAHPAVIENGTVLTHVELRARVNAWAAYLTQLGLAEGDVIGVALRDTTDHITANWAVARMGGVILPIDHRWSDVEKQRVVEAFGAVATLVEPGDVSTKAIILDDAFRANASSANPGAPYPENWDAPLALSLSSGTTGRPTGPAITHRQMHARFMTQFISLGVTEHDRYLSATPIYFGGGRSYTMSATFIGATVIMFPPPYDAADLVRAARQTDATTTLLVPTILRRLLAEDRDCGLLLPTLRRLLSTGAIVHADERGDVMRRLCPGFINYYGSTEGGGVSILTPAHGPEVADSVGQIVFGTEVEIADDDHRAVAAGEVGRIRYRGAGVATGFHNDPAASAEAFRDGWFYPGDLGRLDASGFLYLVGRAKDVIIRGGVNIYPAEIEAALLDHPDVSDAMAIGWPSREMGEEVAAFVVPLPGRTISEDVLRAHCRRRLAAYKAPRAVFVLDTLPKTDTGKVRKDELTARLPSLDA